MLASRVGGQVGTGGRRVELGLFISPSPTKVRSHSPSPSCPGEPWGRRMGESSVENASVLSPVLGLCPLEVTEWGSLEL